MPAGDADINTFTYSVSSVGVGGGCERVLADVQFLSEEVIL